MNEWQDSTLRCMGVATEKKTPAADTERRTGHKGRSFAAGCRSPQTVRNQPDGTPALRRGGWAAQQRRRPRTPMPRRARPQARGGGEVGDSKPEQKGEKMQKMGCWDGVRAGRNSLGCCANLELPIRRDAAKCAQTQLCAPFKVPGRVAGHARPRAALHSVPTPSEYAMARAHHAIPRRHARWMG